jgi:hypothetical protein
MVLLYDCPMMEVVCEKIKKETIVKRKIIIH